MKVIWKATLKFFTNKKNKAMLTSKPYIHFTSYSGLINWSVQYLFDTRVSYIDKYQLVRIGEFLKRNRTVIDIEDNKEYKRVTIKINNGGTFLRDIQKGTNIGTKKQFVISEGQFLLSKIDARNGAFGVVPKLLDRAIVTNDFPAFDVDVTKILPHYLLLVTTTKMFMKFVQSCSSGTTNRQRMDIEKFLIQKIPLPSLEEQNRIVKSYSTYIRQAETSEQQANDLEKDIDEYLFDTLGIQLKVKKNPLSTLTLINSSNIKEWGVSKILEQKEYLSSKYEVVSFDSSFGLFREILRGKSPKYSNQSSSIILNQKCNRWNEIELSHAKSVCDKWINSLNKNHFTKVGDIIINSTGEGTIGRASTIKDSLENLMYDNHILLLRINPQKIFPNYFTILFNSRYGQHQINSLKSAETTKQTELGIGNLKKFKFPLPNLSDQEIIANHIQNLKNEILTLRQNAEENRKRAIKNFKNEIFE